MCRDGEGCEGEKSDGERSCECNACTAPPDTVRTISTTCTGATYRYPSGLPSLVGTVPTYSCLRYRSCLVAIVPSQLVRYRCRSYSPIYGPNLLALPPMKVQYVCNAFHCRITYHDHDTDNYRSLPCQNTPTRCLASRLCTVCRYRPFYGTKVHWYQRPTVNVHIEFSFGIRKSFKEGGRGEG